MKNKKMQSPSTTSNSFYSLTEEIVHAILDYLQEDPFAKKSFSLTCKFFYSVESNHRRALKPLRPELLPRTLQRYSHIQHLDFTLCPLVDDNTLSSVSLALNKNLKSINLSRSKLFSDAGLGSLVTNCRFLMEIDLSNGVELNDLAAAAIGEAKNLEKLWLARCKLISDMGIGCIAVGCRKLKLVSLKWCLKIGDLGIELLALKCKDIRNLDLSYLQITEKCLPAILKLQNLEDLTLEGCIGIDDAGLSTLQQKCISLKVKSALFTLNLTNCQAVGHVGFSSLTDGAENLQELNLAYGSAVTEDLVKCFRAFSGLQSLKLDGCFVTSSGIRSIGDMHTSLKELSLSKCSGVTDESLSYLLQVNKGLKKLDLTCCGKLTNDTIECITNSCNSISSLKMESCSSVSKEAFLLIGQRCRFLEELDITDSEVDDEGFSLHRNMLSRKLTKVLSSHSGLKAISRCSKLTILKLGICVNITDSGLKHIGNSCSKLKELDLYRSMGITDVGIAAITDGCPELETINVAYNENVTGASLRSLSGCSSLKVLEIRGCPMVSSDGLSAIAAGCRKLTVLDLKKCFNINDTAMLPLAKYSQKLKQINLSYCSVTDSGILALASINRLQNMTILHLKGLTLAGLAMALVACRGLTKVKLHASFKPLLSKTLLEYMEARGCVLLWRNKVFQDEVDPKGWKLHFMKTESL